MRLEVLVSCMHQSDIGLIGKSKITTDAVMINQCDVNNIQEYKQGKQIIRKVDTLQRGLSNSRNMALKYSKGEVCLICDDDEVFLPDYEEKILNAFEQIPDADIIIFRISNHPCKLKQEVFRLNYFDCLRVASWQIAFRKKSVLKSSVRFDPQMGAGSGNGCGEENKFLLDCYRAGMKIYHVPEEIASVAQEESTWFFGFDRKFFYQRGITTRYMLGLPISVLYAFYYALTKRAMFKKDISVGRALASMLSGIWHNDISKQKRRQNE